jgi:hypothetical protein
MNVAESFEIKPGEGLGGLKFGSSMEEAEKCFGQAEEVEDLEGEGDYKATVWHYWERGFSLFFDESGKQTFTCVEIDNESALLWGARIFEMSEADIISLFKKKGYKEIDTEVHEWGEKRISFDDALVDLYFEHGELVSINYGVFDNSQPGIIFFPN